MRSWLVWFVLVAAATPLRAQGLEGRLRDLFIFGTGDNVLVLGGSAGSDNPAIQIHGMHFVPAAVAGNATLISFLTNAISANVTNIPLSASSGGQTFKFEGATPVATSISAGPIYAERAQTLGRGRVFVGLSRSGLQYQTLRGVPLNDIRFTFAHANVDFPGCDSIVGGNCSLYGVPLLENETIDFHLDLNVSTDVTNFLLTYGITNALDFGVVVPFVNTTIRGTSNAEVIPFGQSVPPAHFFSGTPENPVFTASRFSEGSSSGLGDVSARVKLRLREGTPVSVAVLAEGRFPTGSEEDLRGSGAVQLRGLGIMSARLGDFSPHVNMGYTYRGGSLDTDSFLFTAGFDQLLARWATFAADVISEFQVGTSQLTLPPDATLEFPYHRTIDATNIPGGRDDIVSASLGAKLTIPQGVTFLANGLFPLNRGGMRPDVLWTAGVEYAF